MTAYCFGKIKWGYFLRLSTESSACSRMECNVPLGDIFVVHRNNSAPFGLRMLKNIMASIGSFKYKAMATKYSDNKARRKNFRHKRDFLKERL